MLPLIGLVAVEGLPALASVWMSNGTLNEYLEGNEDVDIMELVCVISGFGAWLSDDGGS